MTTTAYWTVVQHSAWSTRKDPDFQRGLESASITPKEADKVRAAGGMVFTDYSNAENYADAEQYPPGVAGLIPQALGEFASLAIGGRQVYLPIQFPFTATYRWDHGFAALKKQDGQTVTVLRPAVVPDEADAEVGPMFLARFADGEENFVYPDEIETTGGAR